MSIEMLKLIEQYPVFFAEGYRNNRIHACVDACSIIYAGMGGSAITGDVLKSYFRFHAGIPFEGIRDYNIPAYADENTLLIISSFSGNTEEALSCLKQGIEKKCIILGIGSGGKTEKIIRKNKWDFISMPLDVPPRTAMGMSLGAMLNALSGFFTDNFNRQVLSAVRKLDKYKFRHKEAEEIAGQLTGRMPFIYSSSDYVPVIRRFANQLSENAKQIAHFNELPEMNHNEIVGLMHPACIMENALCIFTRFSDDNESIIKRMDITADIISQNGTDVMNLLFEDKNPVYNLINSIIFTDLVSYYCAIKNGEDPVGIKRIDTLKREMKK